MATLGTISALTWASSVSLVELPSHPHARVLDALIGLANSKIRDIEQCVPDLGDETREFIAELRIDPGGSVAAAAVQGGPATTTECVAAKLSSIVTLPVRVAREFSRVDLRVEVRPSPFGSGVLDGGALWGGDDWGGAVWERGYGAEGVGSWGDDDLEGWEPIDDDEYGGGGQIGGGQIGGGQLGGGGLGGLGTKGH
jgi:hypothetical protein